MSKIMQIGNICDCKNGFNNRQRGRVYLPKGLSPSIDSCQGGGREPKVIVRDIEEDTVRIIDDTYGFDGIRNYKSFSPTLRSERTGLKVMNKENNQYKIRKLTPLECWRLMGFSDEDFNKAKWYSQEEIKKILEEHPKRKGKKQFTEEQRIERVSNSQLYKQAGNSIVVDVLYYIYKELYNAMPYLFDDLKVGSYFSGIGAFEKGLDRLFDDINSDVLILIDSVEPKCTEKDERNVIVYDDYNSNIREDQNTIGTITSTIGNICLRNGYKLIENDGDST